MFDFLKTPFRVFAVVSLCAVAFSQTSQGPTMMPQINGDFYVGQVNGFYPTIQSAVTATCAISSGPRSLGSRVIVSAGSPADGTSGYTISAVTGCAKVPIIDQRAQPATTCSWGSSYVCSSGGGGGGTPGGSDSQVQVNRTGSFGVDPLFTNNATTHNTKTGGLNSTFNSDLFGTGNNGIATLQGLSVTDIMVPSGSTSTENGVTATTVPGTHLQLRTPGGVLDYYYNTSPGSSQANSITDWCAVDQPTTIEIQSRCHQLTALWSDAGEDVVGTPTVHVADQVIATAYGQGIHQARNTMFNCFTDDDCGLDYGYLAVRAAALAAASEGSVLSSRQGLEGNAGTIYTVLSSSSTATGSVVTLNAPGLANSTNLVDLSTNIESGIMTGTANSPGGMVPTSVTTSTSHSLSTGFGFLSASCGANQVRNNPQPATCPFTVGTVSGVTGFGSFNTTTKVAVGDFFNFECAKATVVAGGNITLMLSYSHPANTPIYQGVGTCDILIEGNGNSPINASASGTFPTFPIMGARSANAWDVIYPMKNGQNGLITIPVPAPQSASITSASQTGTTVTLTGVGLGFLNHYSPLAGQSICVSGVSNSAFNICGITGAVGTNGGFTLTYTVGTSASITGTGGVINVGQTGAPTVNGFANYAIKCGAFVTHINGVTFNAASGDGSAQVAYNDCAWTPGHSVQDPNNIAQTFLGSRVSWIADTPPTLFGSNALNEWSGAHAGFSGGNFLGMNVETSDPIGAFVNYGGTFQAHTGILDADHGMGTLINMLHAPINTDPGKGSLGGAFAHIGLFEGGGFQTNYDLFELESNSGGEGLLNWDVTSSTLSLSNTVGAPTFNVKGTLAGANFFMPQNPNSFLPNQFSILNLPGYTSFGNAHVGQSDALMEAGGYFANTIYAGSQGYFDLALFPTFTPGTTTYCYVMTSTTAFAGGGAGETLPSSPACLSNGPTSLTSGANIIVEGVAQGGSNGARVYRTSGPGGAGFICSFVAPNNSCPDTGSTAGAAPPTVDTTGQFFLSGSQPLTRVQGSTGNAVLAYAGGAPATNNIAAFDASGNAKDSGVNISAITSASSVLGPLQVPNLFSAVNPPQTLSPFTVQADQVFNSNTLYFSDGTPYNAAGTNYIANGNYIADQTFTCRANPGACSDTFILNLLTKYTARVDGNGQFPINISPTLTPAYYSAFDFHHAFASADGAIFMPQLLYLYCQKYGLASTQCGSAYTANVAAIKTAWAFYPRDSTSHLFQVVSGNEYLMTTGFEEYVRNTGLVANGNVWYAADMADLAAIATAQGDSTSATFFNTEHANVVTGIRANLIDGTNGLLISATGNNSGNDDLATSTLATACDLQPSVQAACGVLTSGQKTTIETYLNTNYSTLVNANGAVLQTPQSAWAQFGCVQTGGGTPYSGGGCAGYTGSQYQGARWFYFNDQFALALGQVSPSQVAIFLNTSLNPASGDTAMEWNDRASTAMPGASSTNYMASVQWPVAVNNTFPLAQTVTAGVGCLNKYGASVNSGCSLGTGLIYGTNNITTALTPVVFSGNATNNQILKMTSADTGNTAVFLENTSTGSHEWADLVLGAAFTEVGDRVWLDATTGYIPFGMHTTSSSAGAVILASAAPVTWSTTNSAATASVDTGLSRDSAGTVDLGNGAALDKSGTLNLAQVGIGPVTVSALPTCTTGIKGAEKVVSDATTPTYLGTLTGGGGVTTPVVCNGTAWVSY